MLAGLAGGAFQPGFYFMGRLPRGGFGIRSDAMVFEKKLRCEIASGTLTRAVAVKKDEVVGFVGIVKEMNPPSAPFSSRSGRRAPTKWFPTRENALAYAKEQVQASLNEGMVLCS